LSNSIDKNKGQKKEECLVGIITSQTVCTLYQKINKYEEKHKSKKLTHKKQQKNLLLRKIY
jgi:hypothetical protein